MLFSCDPHLTFQVVERVRKVTSLPLIVKLSPNVTDITAIARAAEDAGADAVSLINTLLSMAIDLDTRTPRLPLGFGAYQARLLSRWPYAWYGKSPRLCAFR